MTTDHLQLRGTMPTSLRIDCQSDPVIPSRRRKPVVASPPQWTDVTRLPPRV